MRHQISWTDLAGARVAVWGLGAEGRANLARLRLLGADITLVDDNAGRSGEDGVVATADGGLERMLVCEAVIKSPGISRYRPEVSAVEEAGVPVLGGLGLWLEDADRERVVCITGTKGKSTTTSIAAHLGTGLGVRSFAGGNLGSPPWDPAAPTDVDVWFIETSSYQATDVASSPPVTAVTSLSPDHLPWHGDTETYIRDKLSLCSRPGARLTIASAMSPLLQEHVAQLGPQVEWVHAGDCDGTWAAPLGLLGAHNAVNAEIARRCLVALGVADADDHDALRRAAEGFEGLESRLQLVHSVGGVDFVDDGLSTNVLPTLAAVEAFGDRRIALIAGGLDRDLEYGSLAIGLARRNGDTRVLTVYETGPRIQAAVDAVANRHLDAVPCPDLEEAVRRGAEWAAPDGVVLLSPAAASFDAFDDYRHRSRVFVEAARALGATDG